MIALLSKKKKRFFPPYTHTVEKFKEGIDHPPYILAPHTALYFMYYDIYIYVCIYVSL